MLQRGPLEELIATIWESVLDVWPVGSEDGFLELGGHSLAAIQILSRSSEILDLELPLRHLLANTTVAQLARDLTAAAGARWAEIDELAELALATLRLNDDEVQRALSEEAAT